MPGINTKRVSLDKQQIFQRAFDPTTDRLRVDSEATVTLGTVEVIIDQTTDSIKIGDGTDLMAVNADGSINVNIAVAGVPAITNVSIPLANTEYTIAFPANVRSFYIKLRKGAAKFAFTSGQSGSNYLSIYKGSNFALDNIKSNGLSLYIQSNTASDTLEVLTWV
jgi:hypothetical protein